MNEARDRSRQTACEDGAGIDATPLRFGSKLEAKACKEQEAAAAKAS